MAADGEHLVSMLNISRPLIVCLARSDGTLTPWQFPDSWEDGVVQVRSPEHLRAYAAQMRTEAWKADYLRRHPNKQHVSPAVRTRAFLARTARTCDVIPRARTGLPAIAG